MIEMLFVGGCVATASMFPLEIENFRHTTGHTYMMVRADNRSECNLDRIMFECTLRDAEGRAVEIKKGRVRLLAAGKSGHHEVVMRRGIAHSATCRVTTVMDAPR